MYTAALEMHIEVLQGLQKVAAYTDDMFSPEEIDLHLTKQQNRLVEEIVNKKFEDVQVGLDYIKPLIVKNNALQVFIPQTADAMYESSMVYAILPPEYLHLITDRSGVVTSNNTTVCSDLTGYKTNNTFLSNYTEYIAAVPMFTPLVTQAPYYYKFTMTLTVAGNPVSIVVPQGLWNIKSANSSFSITNYVMENFRFNNVKIYWESYRGVFYPNSFVLVTSDATITQVSISCTKSESDVSNGGSAVSNFNAGTVYKVPNYAAIPGYQLSYTSNQLTENDDLYTQNANPFYKSNQASPKSVLASNYLMIYESKSFLISKALIDYVRIPRQISLSLNQISELGGNGPSVVVDRTIEYLKLAIENPSYQAVLNDNTTRNQL
jgi:hypothetical protein